jgi:RNA polymerase sigma factor (sigma-70 family)
VTKNRVLDELRANERRPRALVHIDEIAPLEVLDAPVERLEAIAAVWRAVDELNPDLKMALLLRDVVGMPYAEIADSLEVTLATVKWRIHKARDEVQLALAREGITYGRAGQADTAPVELVPVAENGAV